MDKKVLNLWMGYDELESKYPNITKLNRTILEFHVKKMYESLESCKKAVEEIKKYDKDFTKEELLVLYRVLPFINFQS